MENANKVNIKDVLESVPSEAFQKLADDKGNVPDAKNVFKDHDVRINGQKVTSASGELQTEIGPKHKQATVTIDGESYHVDLKQLADTYKDEDTKKGEQKAQDLNQALGANEGDGTDNGGDVNRTDRQEDRNR